MSDITKAWEKARLEYQQRYVKYLKDYDETGDKYAQGHLNECSYVLISVFGLTDKQIRELEYNYSGLTDSDLNR